MSANPILSYVSEWSDGDVWGDTMTALFALADVRHFVLGDYVRDFEPSPFGPDSDDPCFIDVSESLASGEVTPNHVRHAYRVLSRRRDILRAAGCDY